MHVQPTSPLHTLQSNQLVTVTCRCVQNLPDECAVNNGGCWQGDFKVNGQMKHFSACSDNIRAYRVSVCILLYHVGVHILDGDVPSTRLLLPSLESLASHKSSTIFLCHPMQHPEAAVADVSPTPQAGSPAGPFMCIMTRSL